MKVCESLAVFDSPDLINLAFESSTGIQRAAKLENEDYPTRRETWPLEPLGSPRGGLERTVRSKSGELLPGPGEHPPSSWQGGPLCAGSWFCFLHTKETCAGLTSLTVKAFPSFKLRSRGVRSALVLEEKEELTEKPMKNLQWNRLLSLGGSCYGNSPSPLRRPQNTCYASPSQECWRDRGQDTDGEVPW